MSDIDRKIARKLRNKIYYEENKEKLSEKNKTWAKNNRERSREIKRKYKESNKIRAYMKQKLIYQFNKEFCNIYKSENGCIECGEVNPLILDFHHLGAKTRCVSELCNYSDISLVRLEIEKCCVLCHNCHTILHKGTRKSIYEQNITELEKLRVGKNRDFLDSCKGSGCSKCGESDIRCLEFHHIDEKSKKFNLGSSYSKNFFVIVEEVKKCEIVCANCHRLYHILEKYIENY